MRISRASHARALDEELVVRPLQRSDLASAVELWTGAFDVALPDEQARSSTCARLAFSLETDPNGSFVAERNGELVGISQALLRERLWILSSLAVSPRAQGHRIGALLLRRALAYGPADADRLIVSSNDPRALALYQRSGLAARRTLQAEGALTGPRASAAAREFRLGGLDDVPHVAELSREIRGGPHTREIAFALQQDEARLLLGEQAFAVVRPGQGVWLLVARTELEARALLLGAIATAGRCERPVVRWVTEDQGWAIEVFESAGLSIHSYGALCVGGAPGPLVPFIPSGSFA